MKQGYRGCFIAGLLGILNLLVSAPFFALYCARFRESRDEEDEEHVLSRRSVAASILGRRPIYGKVLTGKGLGLSAGV